MTDQWSHMSCLSPTQAANRFRYVSLVSWRAKVACLASLTRPPFSSHVPVLVPLHDESKTGSEQDRTKQGHSLCTGSPSDSGSQMRGICPVQVAQSRYLQLLSLYPFSFPACTVQGASVYVQRFVTPTAAISDVLADISASMQCATKTPFLKGKNIEGGSR